MYPSLMGFFSCPTLVLIIGSSSGEASSSMRSMSFPSTHMEDPWNLPTPSPLCEPIGTDVPFPAAMIAYQDNSKCFVEPSTSSSWTKEEDPYVLPAWEFESSHVHDCLDSVFPSDEAIIEAMSGIDPP